MIGQDVRGGNLLDACFRSGGKLGDREVEVVNVGPVMPDLALVEIAKGVAHGAGGVGGEVAYGRIEKPCRMGESFLGGQLDLGEGKAWNVFELPGDLSREGKEFDYPLLERVRLISV